MWSKSFLAALLILAGALPAYAIDGQSASAPNPQASAQPPVQGQPGTVTVDVLAFVQSLREQVALHVHAPRNTKTDHGLYDLWHAILRPRAGRMERRLRDLGNRKRWAFHADGTVAGLAPKAWSHAIREMSALYTELGGALKRYERASVSFTSPYGLGLDRPAAVWVGYPLEQLGPVAMERELHRRLRVGRVRWRDELSGYWHLLGRFHVHYLREARRGQRIAVAGETGAMARAQEVHERALHHRRTALGIQMLGIRTLVATLQAAEEDRLRTAIQQVDQPDEQKNQLLTLVQAMRNGRLDARDYEGDRHAEYGQRLRSRWLAVRSKLLTKLSA